jgi:hypothetical protein
MLPVQVHRLLVPETVEDRILALQEKKKELIETALDENAARNVSRLGVRELGYLFVSGCVTLSPRLLILRAGRQWFVAALTMFALA